MTEKGFKMEILQFAERFQPSTKGQLKKKQAVISNSTEQNKQ